VRPYAIRQVCLTRQRGGPLIQSGATVPVLFCPPGRRLVGQVGGEMKLKVKWRGRAGAPRAGFFHTQNVTVRKLASSKGAALCFMPWP